MAAKSRETNNRMGDNYGKWRAKFWEGNQKILRRRKNNKINSITKLSSTVGIHCTINNLHFLFIKILSIQRVQFI
jgi:hypothetical protein